MQINSSQINQTLVFQSKLQIKFFLNSFYIDVTSLQKKMKIKLKNNEKNNKRKTHTKQLK